MNIFKRLLEEKEEVIVGPIIKEKMYYINNYVGGADTNFYTFLGKWHESEEAAEQENIDLHKKLNKKYIPLRKSISKSEVEEIKRGTNMSISEALECVSITVNEI